MSKERGIIFSGPMVRAILEGRKTQTRRVVKPQPGRETCHYTWIDDRVHWARCSTTDNPYYPPSHCPHGQPGDLLWVRETWQHLQLSGVGAIAYRASCPNDRFDWSPERGTIEQIEIKKWRPSIHMPKDLARLWLRVVDVRVERVREITAHSIAHHEGVTQDDSYRTNSELIRIFSGLWDPLNAKRGFGWEANPWVFVIEFERTEKP